MATAMENTSGNRESFCQNFRRQDLLGSIGAQEQDRAYGSWTAACSELSGRWPSLNGRLRSLDEE